MNIAGFVGMTDQELIVHAMRNAQSLLAEHIDRGSFDAEEALTQLLEVSRPFGRGGGDRPFVSRIWIAPIKMRRTQGSHRAASTGARVAFYG